MNVGDLPNSEGESGWGYVLEVGGDIGFHLTEELSLVALGEVGPRFGDGDALLLDAGLGLRWRPAVHFELLVGAAYFGAFGSRYDDRGSMIGHRYLSSVGGLAKLTYLVNGRLGPYFDLKASTQGAKNYGVIDAMSAVVGMSLAF